MSANIRRIARTLGIAAALMGTTAPLAAQSLSFAPTVGVYIPTTELLKAATGESFKQEVSISVGADLNLWFTERLGIEGTGTWVPSSVQLSTSGPSLSESANIWTATGKVTVFLIPPSKIVSLAVSGGVAWIARSGTAYADVTDKSDIGGAFGAAAGFRLGPIISLRVAVDSYIYNSTVFEDVAAFTGTETTTQKDFQISFGVGIPLLGLGK